MGRIEKTLARQEQLCLAPGCSGIAIQSHSQQRLGQLKVIAEGGQVYGLMRNMYRALKPEEQGPVRMVRLGIREATTFRGFCAYHDRVLFAAIETAPLTKDAADQVVRLFLRSVSYERAQKRRGYAVRSGLLADSQLALHPDFTSETNASLIGIEHALTHDLPFYENLLFDAIASSDCSAINWRWLVVPGQLPVSTCCAYSPLGDRHNEYRSKHWNEPQPMVSFNLIPTSEETHVVVAWARCHDRHCGAIQTDLDTDPEGFVNRVAITETEDTVFRPTFWLGLSSDMQSAVREAIRHEMYRGQLNSVPRILRFGRTE